MWVGAAGCPEEGWTMARGDGCQAAGLGGGDAMMVASRNIEGHMGAMEEERARQE